MLILEQPALYSSIQDQGRAFQGHLGISLGGVNDRLAALLGNRVLGNEDNAAVLELIQPPARLLFVTGHHVVFTGADAEIRCNGQRLPLYARCWLPAGSQVEIARPVAGSTVYVCVAGGFNCPVILGSRSTDPRLGMTTLIKQSFLPTQIQHVAAKPNHLKIEPRYPNGFTLSDLYSPVLDALPSSQFGLLDTDSQQQLVSRTFTVSSQSSRMGIRLLGESLIAPTQQCISAGVCMGAVQLPPQGLPILLAAEHQTTGGYPLVLQVCTHHLSRMAQLRAGEKIRFNLLTTEQAHHKQQQWQNRLHNCLKQINSYVQLH
jgi:biotin-dependent carboxylase-like uncharacterized protein